ncbi:MAG: NAD(P)-dependent oxidoreductase [Chthoniobacteraceae bacterium]
MALERADYFFTGCLLAVALRNFVKLFVTGPSGFIGTAFCSCARLAGHQVAGLERPFRLVTPPWEEIRRFAPDACIHTAWITKPGEYLDSPLNAEYGRWSIDFINEMKEMGTRHFVVLGTCIEYAPDNWKLCEGQSLIAPRSPYSIAKNTLRIVLEKELQAAGFTFAWARLFYPYGPGEHSLRLSSSIVRQLRHDQEVVLKTPGSVRDYIHIDDVARALLAVTERRFSGPINIGTGEGFAIRDIANTIAGILKKPGLVREALPQQPDEYPCIVADVQKLAGLAWRPHHTLASGLQTLLDSMP